MHNQINTALCAMGTSGTIFHIPFLLIHPGFKITKVLERSKENSKTKLPDAQIVRNYNEIVNDREIDLIIVNAPNELHYQMTKQALLSGKHVLVEKPFTVSVEEGEELIELAKKQGLVLTIYHNRRLDSDFKTIQKLLQENILGEIELFDSRILRWKPDLGTKLWKLGKNRGAGLLYDLGSHLIDQALVLFGIPKAVFADLRILRAHAVTDDYFELILDYDSLKVTLRSSLLSNNPGPRFIVRGDKACYTKFGNDPQEEMLMNGKLPTGKDWGKENESACGVISSLTESYSYASLSGSYQNFFENLHKAIKIGKELIVKPQEALNVIKIIESAFRSHKENQVIQLE